MNLEFQQKPTKRAKLSLQLFVTLVIFCSIPAPAAQRAAQTFTGVKMAAASPLIIGARNAELVAPPTVDPPSITFEITQLGHHFTFEDSTSPLGPWRTLFRKQNEYVQPTMRVTVYKTNTAMFYRSRYEQ